MPGVLAGGQQIEYQGIMLDSQEYELVEERDAEGRERRSVSWELKPQATKRERRPDVQPGAIDGEWVWSQDDWSGGLTGELECRPRSLHMAVGCDGLTPGAIKLHAPFSVPNPVSPGIIEPPNPVLFNGSIFTFQGRYVLRWSAGTVATDKDFGDGVSVQCAVIHNNELVVGFGGSTNGIATRTAGGTWTGPGGVTNYADWLHHTGDGVLWRATATSQVSNILATAQPRTASWSAGITVGEAGNGITGLGNRGLQLIVAKPEGCFPGDAGAVFENILPEFGNAPHPDNGKRMLVNGSDIFYPHEAGVKLIRSGITEEVGVQKLLTSNSSERTTGSRIYALAADGAYVWAAAGTSGYPRVMPSAVLKTTDAGVNYTDITSTLNDGNPGTTNVVALDTIANGDWMLVGYSSQLFGIYLDIATPNATAATLTVEFSATGGADWSALAFRLFDRTTQQSLATPATAGATPGARSGYIYMVPNAGVTIYNSAQGTYGGYTLNWWRISASAAITVTISEVRISTDISTWLFRGRPGRPEDNVPTSWVWEPYDVIVPAGTTRFPLVQGLAVLGGSYPHRAGAVLVASGISNDFFYQLGPYDRLGSGALNFSGTAQAITGRCDFGSSAMQKDFRAIRIKGKTIDGTRDVAIDYRLDTATAWTSASTSVTTSPTTIALSGVQGYSIQLRVAFNAATATNDQPTEVNLTEVVARDTPTMKREWNYLIKIPVGGETPSETQLTNLEALIGGVAVTHMDIFRRLYTVNVMRGGAAERYRSESGVPALAVPIIVTEV